MNQLKLLKSDSFDGITCDFYGDGKEFFMTRDQVGEALEYGTPVKAISNLHSAHKSRLDKLSTILETRKVEGEREVTRKTIVYNRKGIMEICRWSQQPKADAFMDWVWGVMDGLLSGKTKLVGMTEYQQMMAQTRAENAKIRNAQILLKIADKYPNTTYQQVLYAHATKELTGEYLLPLPEIGQRTYTAKEIGDKLGISAHMVGRLTNAHGLKTEKFGSWYNDTAKHCAGKEVNCFRYFESVVPEIQKFM